MSDSGKKRKGKSRDRPGRKLDPEPPLEEGDDTIEYEDRFEDEFEEEKEVVEGEEGDVDMDDMPVKAWLGDDSMLQDDETLDYDTKAYEMFHRLHVEWPALSFDIIRDNLGFERKSYPATCYLVMGSQADRQQNNKITLMKMSQLARTKFDDDDSSSGEEEDEEMDYVDPIVEVRRVNHPYGTINRIQSMPQNPHIVSTWAAEESSVMVFDLLPHVKALDGPMSMLSDGRKPDQKCKPIFRNKKHFREGWALSWSCVNSGLLASGDCSGSIHVSSVGESVDVSEAFLGHEASVEDIQWSPVEGTVFASCSVDKSIRIWDTRTPTRTPSIGVSNTHSSDVNVIAWNPNASHLLASGGDDGALKVWDLRKFGEAASGLHSEALAGNFTFHKGPIVSVEWKWDNESILCAGSEDNRVTFWDFSLEKDESMVEEDDVRDIPPQLLFVHQGQKNVKEVHFHPQLPGVAVTTASDGINIFRPCNIQ